MNTMRLEQLPKLKQKIEEFLSNLVKDTEVAVIDWEAATDVGERSIQIKIIPRFKELADDNRFGTIGEKGSDELPKLEFKQEFSEDN